MPRTLRMSVASPNWNSACGRRPEGNASCCRWPPRRIICRKGHRDMTCMDTALGMNNSAPGAGHAVHMAECLTAEWKKAQCGMGPAHHWGAVKRTVAQTALMHVTVPHDDF